MSHSDKISPVNVLICSSFPDMHTERDVLMKRVFPYLSDKLKKKSLSINSIGLNWGSNVDASNNEQMLELVGSTFNHASILISILGERFDLMCALQTYLAYYSPTTELIVLKRDVVLTTQLAKNFDESIYYGPNGKLAVQQNAFIHKLQHLSINIYYYASFDTFALLASEQLQAVIEKLFFEIIGTVFISYSRSRTKDADKILKMLEKSRFSVFIDRYGIDYGDDWRDKIVEEICGCDVVLFLVSEFASDSNNCANEISIAVEEGKPILSVYLDPVHLTGTLRYELTRMQRINLYEYNKLNEGIEEIVEGLKKIVLAKKEERQPGAQPD